jgi:ABC-type transport system involved in multi-copper enzyme maturation permease subunit
MRLVRSRSTVINALLLAMAVLACIAWSLRRDPTPARFTTEVFVPIYVSFLLPMSCLSYASGSIAGDRQDRTLVYLLATPLPRPLIFLAKYAAATVLLALWNLIGAAVMCRMAGEAGWRAYLVYAPVILSTSLAYTGLFHVFSVLFRRATIVSLGYALFLETFLGNMPGIVKRLAISFYAQCLVFERGGPLGVAPTGGRNPALFQPVTGQTAQLVLAIAALAFVVLGLSLFSRREYD